MKKRVLLLLPLFLGACSDSGESPVITIERLYVNTGPDSEDSKGEDYTNQKDNLPALKVGDKVNAFLLLDGNGAELKTFKLQNDDEVDTKLFYEQTEVSTEGNLTDVAQTRVMVKATIEHVDKNGDVKLAFYLSSKAECEGAQEEIGLKTKEVEEED